MEQSHRPELVVLDVNETLSDMAPMAERFAEVGLERHEAATWFAGVLRDGFALTVVEENPGFADLAGEALRLRLPTGHDDPDGAVRHVLGGFMELGVHPDVVEGLRALRALGIRLVTLSNGSAEVADALLTRAGVRDELEALLSVADAPAWKPDPRAYAHALAATGVEAGRAMLVAVHPWDVDGATRAGLRSAWLRRGAPGYPSYAAGPEVVAADLLDLARRLG
jgi:2-haloacid dehalogenase